MGHCPGNTDQTGLDVGGGGVGVAGGGGGGCCGGGGGRAGGFGGGSGGALARGDTRPLTGPSCTVMVAAGDAIDGSGILFNIAE